MKLLKKILAIIFILNIMAQVTMAEAGTFSKKVIFTLRSLNPTCTNPVDLFYSGLGGDKVVKVEAPYITFKEIERDASNPHFLKYIDEAVSSDGKKISMKGFYNRKSKKNVGMFLYYKNQNVVCEGSFEIKNQ